MSQYQVGTLKSIPKLTRVNADDSDALMVKNLGNGRRVPFLWSTLVKLTSGTSETIVASGVSFNGFRPCDGHILVTPEIIARGS